MLFKYSALVRVTLNDVNEFSPEFERQVYSISLDSDLKHAISHKLLSSPNSDQEIQEEVLLLQVRAKDKDCSAEFGTICRYELLAEPHHWSLQQQKQQHLEAYTDLISALTVDSLGRVKVKRHFLAKTPLTGSSLNQVWNWHNNPELTRENATSRSSPSSSTAFFSFQVIAYDCGGKKSLAPATIHLHLNKGCRPALKGKL